MNSPFLKNEAAETMMEHSFLEDQRNARRMVIGSLDVQTTVKLQRSQAKCMKTNVSAIMKSPPNLKTLNNSSADTTSASKTSEDQLTQNKQMRLSLSCLALAWDRHMVSDRSAAAIASAVLQDVGLISGEDRTQVIDRHKIRRERGKMRKNAKEVEITSLYFDGRKDKTMEVNEKKKNCSRGACLTDPGTWIELFGSLHYVTWDIKKFTASNRCLLFLKSILQFQQLHAFCSFCQAFSVSASVACVA